MGLKESGLRGSLRNVSVGIDAIPDTSVSRPDDEDVGEGETVKRGLVINSDISWPSIDAKLSANVSGLTKAYIYESEGGNLIGDKDISDLSSGDVFRFDDVDLDPDTDYNLVGDAEGSEYTRGDLRDADFPFESEDGDLRIVDGGINEDDTISTASNFVEIGNLS